MLPIIYSAHHASYNFGTYLDRCALSLEQRKRYCDLGTADTVPQNGIKTLVAQHSRGIVDLNRAPDDKNLFPERDFGRPAAHVIYLPGAEPTPHERRGFKASLYDPYHGEIDQLLVERCSRGEDSYVVAWDNTADYVIGDDVHGAPVQMPSIILSNNGDAGLATGSHVSCDSAFLQELGERFSQTLAIAGLPHDVRYNQVFRGGYITQHYTNFTKTDSTYGGASVQSLQVEYNMVMTHDQKTLKENLQAIAKLKNAFEEAIALTLREF